MLKITINLLLTLSLVSLPSQALAQSSQTLPPTCQKLCDVDFWANSTPKEISAMIALESIDALGNDSATALHYAAGFGTIANIAALLEAGFSLDIIANRGWSPLHVAAAYGPPQNIDFLLQSGANIEALGNDKSTPLHSAAEFGSPANITTLLAAGANGAAKTMDDLTPFDLAADNPKIKETPAYWALKNAQ